MLEQEQRRREEDRPSVAKSSSDSMPMLIQSNRLKGNKRKERQTGKGAEGKKRKKRKRFSLLLRQELLDNDAQIL